MPSDTTSPEKPRTLLDAAELVLSESPYPMRIKPLVEEVIARGLWTPRGKTPDSTLCGLISRDIARKGAGSRFRKVDDGFYGLRRKRDGAGG